MPATRWGMTHGYVSGVGARLVRGAWPVALLATATGRSDGDGRSARRWRSASCADLAATPRSANGRWTGSIASPDPDPMILRAHRRTARRPRRLRRGQGGDRAGRLGADAFDTIDRILEHGTRAAALGAPRWPCTRPTAGIDRFLPQLTRQLAQSDERLVYASLAALARLQSRAAPALPALQKLLTHEQRQVRQATLETLAAIGPAARGLVPELVAAAAGPAARSAVGRGGGHAAHRAADADHGRAARRLPGVAAGTRARPDAGASRAGGFHRHHPGRPRALGAGLRRERRARAATRHHRHGLRSLFDVEAHPGAERPAVDTAGTTGSRHAVDRSTLDTTTCATSRRRT